MKWLKSFKTLNQYFLHELVNDMFSISLKRSRSKIKFFIEPSFVSFIKKIVNCHVTSQTF